MKRRRGPHAPTHGLQAGNDQARGGGRSGPIARCAGRSSESGRGRMRGVASTRSSIASCSGTELGRALQQEGSAEEGCVARLVSIVMPGCVAMPDGIAIVA